MPNLNGADADCPEQLHYIEGRQFYFSNPDTSDIYLTCRWRY